MIVLGIDPGIERVGYAFIKCEGSRLVPISYGLISTNRIDPKPLRIKQIYEDVCKLIGVYKPDAISIETIIFAKNVKTALIISEVRGVFLLISALVNIPLVEFTPLEVKMTITGYGRSNKSQIERAVQMILSLSEIPKPDDVSDALSIAICGANKIAFQNKINR